MSRHRRKLLPLCIAASLLSGLSGTAAAIGVGEIHLQSFLGRPLQAEVPLSHLGDLSADQLKVQIGAQDDYSAMGVEYTYLHSQFKIEPIVKNGQGYVRITSQEPISEPYLNFVLSLRWPQGQLIREFTVLLDPPEAATAIAAAEPKDAQPIAATAATESAAPAPRRQSRRVSREPAAQPAAASEGSYTIQRGDSLWRIANRIRPAQVPVEQVMAAIHERNPGAFINGNPNLLREAATLALPSADQIAAATGSSAPTTTEPAATAPSTPSTDGAPVAVQLVEENAALKAQVADLTSNVATLNQNLAQSEQHLHQLESQLNELIQQMQQQRATVAAMSGNAETHTAPLVQGTGSVINQVNAAELSAPAKAHTPWWVHLLYWLGIGGAVTWAVREHFWPQRRLAVAGLGGATVVDRDEKTAPMARTSVRVPVIEEPEQAAELTLDLDVLPTPSSETAEPAPQLLKASDEAVDVSISAGVFLAFGRFGEAEDLLREAIARDNSRIDLKLQLLDVLMQSDQPGAFDDLAEAIEREAQTPETLAELAVLRDSFRAHR